MIGLLLLARQRAVAAMRGPGAAAVVAYAVVVVLGLPVVAALALAAAPRAVMDLGLLGVRLATLAAAVAAGSSAVGPVLRRGEADPWLARGQPRLGWAAARLAGSGVAVALVLGTCTTLFVARAALLGLAPSPALGLWLVAATLEAVVVTALAAACGAWLRGAAGPIGAVAWVLLGHLRGAWRALEPSGEGVVGLLLGLVAPDLAAFDLTPSLLGAPPPALVPLVLHATGWTLLGAALAGLAVLRR